MRTINKDVKVVNSMISNYGSVTMLYLGVLFGLITTAALLKYQETGITGGVYSVYLMMAYCATALVLMFINVRNAASVTIELIKSIITFAIGVSIPTIMFQKYFEMYPNLIIAVLILIASGYIIMIRRNITAKVREYGVLISKEQRVYVTRLVKINVMISTAAILVFISNYAVALVSGPAVILFMMFSKFFDDVLKED